MAARSDDAQGGPETLEERLREMLRRARESAPLMPPPPADAPTPPRAWSDVGDEDEEEGGS